MVFGHLPAIGFGDARRQTRQSFSSRTEPPELQRWKQLTSPVAPVFPWQQPDTTARSRPHANTLGWSQSGENARSPRHPPMTRRGEMNL
jgi:hypothetical protein